MLLRNTVGGSARPGLRQCAAGFATRGHGEGRRVTQPEYFSRDGLLGSFFACAPLAATLSTATCAARFNEAQSRERFFACKNCPVGAHHAGKPPPIRSPLNSKRVCARCLRQAPRVVWGRWCVSCFNRQQEVIKGRNAKGAAPKKLRADMMRDETIIVRLADGRVKNTVIDQALNFAEAAIVAARRLGVDAWLAPGGSDTANGWALAA